MRTSVALYVLSAVAVTTTSQAAADSNPWTAPRHERGGADIWGIDNPDIWNINRKPKAAAHSWHGSHKEGGNTDWIHHHGNLPSGHKDSIHKGARVIHFGNTERTWEVNNHDNTDSITWKSQQKLMNPNHKSNDMPHHTKHRRKKPNHGYKSKNKLKSVEESLVSDKPHGVVLQKIVAKDNLQPRNNDNKHSRVITQGTRHKQMWPYRSVLPQRNNNYWYVDAEFPNVAFLLPGVSMGGPHIGKVYPSWQPNTVTGEMVGVTWDRNVESIDVTNAHRKNNAWEWNVDSRDVTNPHHKDKAWEWNMDSRDVTKPHRKKSSWEWNVDSRDVTNAHHKDKAWEWNVDSRDVTNAHHKNNAWEWKVDSRDDTNPHRKKNSWEWNVDSRH